MNINSMYDALHIVGKLVKIYVHSYYLEMEMPSTLLESALIYMCILTIQKWNFATQAGKIEGKLSKYSIFYRQKNGGGRRNKNIYPKHGKQQQTCLKRGTSMHKPTRYQVPTQYDMHHAAQRCRRLTTMATKNICIHNGLPQTFRTDSNNAQHNNVFL